MKHAAAQRFTTEDEVQAKKFIYATDDMFNELQDMPFQSSKYKIFHQFTNFISIGKNGKTWALLKAGTKRHISRKKRKVIPLFGTLKQYKDSKSKPVVDSNAESN